MGDVSGSARAFESGSGDLQYRFSKVNSILSAEKHGSIPVMELIPLQSLL